MQKKLLFIVNVDWFFISHWLHLARTAKHAGYDVHVATSNTKNAALISAEGFICHDIAINRSGTNPIVELLTAVQVFRLLKTVKPDIVHLMTIKPVIYGGLACRLAGIPAVVVGITGLGFVFINKSFKVKLLRLLVVRLYKAVFRHKNILATFENAADKAFFLQSKIVTAEQAKVVDGAGVDLEKYSPSAAPAEIVVITFAARILKDKGFFEFITAARSLKQKYGEAIAFWVAGSPDPVNPASVSQIEIDKLSAENVVTFLGFQSNMADIFSKSSVVVLPSYREGLPKVLMEAAACGRPVITTDVPGCRHVIIPGSTGLLVPPGKSRELAEAILLLINNPDVRVEFGKRGRELAEARFSADKVSADYLSMYHKLLNRTC
jgi:glycosyltransferase involved in cell wall biosynthesis